MRSVGLGEGDLTLLALLSSSLKNNSDTNESHDYKLAQLANRHIYCIKLEFYRLDPRVGVWSPLGVTYM